MCNYSEGIWDAGKQEGILESLNNLMKNTSYTFDEAADMLGIPVEKRATLRRAAAGRRQG